MSAELIVVGVLRIAQPLEGLHHPSATEPLAFHGTYLDVVPPSRLVWTNEEAGGAGPVTMVTFDERGPGQVVVHDLYPSKEALDEALAAESISWNEETFEQLEAMLGSPASS